MKAYVKGTLAADAIGERYILATIAARYGDGSVKPLFVTNSALDGAGLGCVGLLVRTTGRVTTVGPGYVYIDDGSGLRDGTDTAGIDNIGVRVVCSPAGYAPGEVLSVTGVSSRFAGAGGRPCPQILGIEPSGAKIECGL